MADLINDSSAAKVWVEKALQRHSDSIFGKLVSAVIWSDTRGPNGHPLVDVSPEALIAKFARSPLILLHNHDPGQPKGQVLEAACFVDQDGMRFVAAILGFYAGGDVLNFRDLDIDTETPVPAAESLPSLPEDCWIEIAFDPREVDDEWFEQVGRDAPLSIVKSPLSHNSAEFAHELIRVGLIYLAIAWNPLVTSIASEAGKAAYSATHAWVRKLLERLAERRNPILDFHTFYDDCQMSFLLRGRDLKLHYAAHDVLPAAVAQAQSLVTKLKVRSSPARQLVYEFSKETLRWYPSFVILSDGRMITDSVKLIAIENLPTGLSLGLTARSPGQRKRMN
ncbi:hypothetical protein [Hydrogenophaga palleronii]|uniref:hypothetical protein n=1 Tax=Hydrogenophaga palleronii TaxID=65655 RepID=UPI000A060355|nr:hypothetical protein [Hydrogenophaga palleronii]